MTTTRSSAFTLLELLLSVAVVSILAVLAFAAGGSVRAKADSAKCAANLRAINTALTQFAADHMGNFMPTSAWDTHASYSIQGGSHLGLRDYLGVVSEHPNINANGVKEQFMYDSVLTCPALQRIQRSVMVLHRSYSANTFLFQRDSSSAYNNVPVHLKPFRKHAPLKIANVESPSKMWTFSDAAGLKNSVAYAGSYDSAAYAEHLKYPHNGRNHFVFLSGHIEGLTREQFEERAMDRLFWGKTE